jgi:hypothetical protein
MYFTVLTDLLKEKAPLFTRHTDTSVLKDYYIATEFIAGQLIEFKRCEFHCKNREFPHLTSAPKPKSKNSNPWLKNDKTPGNRGFLLGAPTWAPFG